MLGCAEMNNGLRMWLSVAEVSGLRITKSAFVRFEIFVFEKKRMILVWRSEHE